jgi:starvation-inducible DNA-binding protein
MNVRDAKDLRKAPLETPTDLGSNAVRDISGALNVLLADMFGLYLKTKNFHWHISGRHFRDYHLLLDEQATQIFATTDDIAERVRKIGGTTLHSIGQISRSQRILDNDADYVTPLDMLAELRDDNKQLTANMRETHDLCDRHRDVALAGELDRRGRAAHLVPVRGHSRRRNRLTAWCRPRSARCIVDPLLIGSGVFSSTGRTSV